MTSPEQQRLVENLGAALLAVVGIVLLALLMLP